MFYDWSECVMSVLGTTKHSLYVKCCCANMNQVASVVGESVSMMTSFQGACVLLLWVVGSP